MSLQENVTTIENELEISAELQRQFLISTSDVVQRCSFGIYHLTCPHLRIIAPSLLYWCKDCDDHLTGKLVCTVQLTWRKDGTVIAHGEGYCDATE